MTIEIRRYHVVKGFWPQHHFLDKAISNKLDNEMCLRDVCKMRHLLFLCKERKDEKWKNTHQKYSNDLERGREYNIGWVKQTKWLKHRTASQMGIRQFPRLSSYEYVLYCKSWFGKGMIKTSHEKVHFCESYKDSGKFNPLQKSGKSNQFEVLLPSFCLGDF